MDEQVKRKKGLKSLLLGDGSNSLFDSGQIEQMDRAAQGVIGQAVNEASPLAGQVLQRKMDRYNKDAYGDKEMSESRAGAMRVGARLAPTQFSSEEPTLTDLVNLTKGKIPPPSWPKGLPKPPSKDVVYDYAESK